MGAIDPRTTSGFWRWLAVAGCIFAGFTVLFSYVPGGLREN
jgi:hypothetical protein